MLRSRRLVRSTGPGEQDTIETFHDRIRETITAHLAPEALKDCHGRLARVLEASGHGDPETLAAHYLEADDLAQAARYYAAAADKAAPSEGVMQLQQPSSVAGAQLPAGKYRVQWTATSGEMVDVKVYRGHKEVASTTAQLVKVDAAAYNNVSYLTDDKGARSLTQISFAKQKFALRLGDRASSDAERAAK